MNIKSKTYMRSVEFKTRQLWLPFADAIGIALQVMADVKERAWEWFKTWQGVTRHPKPENRTLPLPFEQITT